MEIWIVFYTEYPDNCDIDLCHEAIDDVFSSEEKASDRIKELIADWDGGYTEARKESHIVK